jgi:branched-chain amino acid transport system permease protein
MTVMPGLVPGIHALPVLTQERRRWPGHRKAEATPFFERLSPAMTRLRRAGGIKLFSMDLLLDAVVIGVLLGCFYAAVSIGLSVSFGLLDVPHVAHPAFLVMASYGVFFLNDSFDIDPLLAGLLITPLLFVFGLAAYRLYYETFERRGTDAAVRGIAFFFGVAFIIEVLIILHFGVDQRSVTASYIGKAWRFGDMRIPLRLVVAFAVATGLTLLLSVYLSRTFMGRAIRAVAQDEEAVRLMGANPVWIKQWAFGIATAVLGVAGALLIIVAPVEPTLDRAYIGRTFCVVVMAGLGSMTGTLIAAIILGVAETIVLTLFGASWAPAISFALLLGVLAVRPQGLLGRRS